LPNQSGYYSGSKFFEVLKIFCDKIWAKSVAKYKLYYVPLDGWMDGLCDTAPHHW